MKTLLFALLASVLLTVPATALGGGGGSEGGNAEESGGRRHRILTSSEDFVPLDPLTATVHSDFRLRGILHIEAGLDIPDNRLRRRAVSLMPRLRDRYVSALAMYAGANYSYGEVPDADRIAVILQQATDEALGQDGAEVLLGMIIIHEN